MPRTLGVMFLDYEVRWVGDKYSLAVKLSPIGLRWPPYISPISITTWSISRVPGDHHYVNLLTLKKVPRIYPIFAAASCVEAHLDKVCKELWESGVFVAGHRTVTGSDL